MNEKKCVRVGTRGSALALVQTKQVISKLQEQHPDWEIETVVLHTQGDKILDKPLVDFGGKGMFISEFEDALLRGEIDLAVHSSKDMPTQIPEGLVLAGVLKRADARDVLVTRRCDKRPLVIGTGSLRRQLQLKELYPNLQCVNIRGNVPTRLEKVRSGVCDGVILAAAGLLRLGLLAEPDFEYHFFSYDEMVPAGGQGIIAIEGRKEDEITLQTAGISDEKAWMELETERRILALLEAGCHEAVGAVSDVNENQIEIRIIREQNGKLYKVNGSGVVCDRMALAEQLVCELLQRERNV